MEALLENAHEIKGKLGEKIQAHKEQGVLSKELATILLDVPVTFEAEDYALSEPDQSKVSVLFEELEFRRMAENFKKIFVYTRRQLLLRKERRPTESVRQQEGQQFDLFAAPGSGNSSESDSSQRKNLTAQEHLYQLVATEKARELLLQKLLQQTQVCFDTETTSLRCLRSRTGGDCIFLDC